MDQAGTKQSQEENVAGPEGAEIKSFWLLTSAGISLLAFSSLGPAVLSPAVKVTAQEMPSLYQRTAWKHRAHNWGPAAPTAPSPNHCTHGPTGAQQN